MKLFTSGTSTCENAGFGLLTVRAQIHAITVGVLDELVAATADGGLAGIEVFGRGTSGDLLRHDVDCGQIVGHQRMRKRRLETNRIRVDDFLADDGLGVRDERAGAVGDLRDAVD